MAIGIVVACPTHLVPVDVSAEEGTTELALGAVGDIASTKSHNNNLNRNQYDDIARLATEMGLDGLLTPGDAHDHWPAGEDA